MRRFLSIWLLTAASALASAITPYYVGSYGLTVLGAMAGASGYGAILFQQGDNNVLLLAGNADYSSGVVDEVTVTRGAGGHITGFGAVSQLSTAPYIDGGLAYAPNGDLLFTQYGGSGTGIGEIKPGSKSPDKVVTSPAGGTGGTLGFVPSSLSGAGNLALASYSQNRFCITTLTADGSGTYNISGCGNPESVSGPDGVVWVAPGAPLFSSGGILVGRGSSVYAYSTDSNGLPNPSTAQSFVTVSGAVGGMAVDPVTGDLLVSTTGPDMIYEVQGFPVPVTNPEPGTVILLATGGAVVLGRRRRGRVW